MANPTRADLYVNRPLTNISVAYMQNTNEFIADKVFPNVPVSKQSDLYWKYDKGEWFRTDATKRAPASESAGSGWNVTTDSYFAHVWALHKDIDDQTRANADQVFDLDRDAARFLTQHLLLRREVEFSRNFLVPDVWGSDFTPAIKWDVTNSVPINDIDSQKLAIKALTGYTPNTLVISSDVLNILKNNASIIDRIKYTQRGVITEDILAAMFGVDRVFVAQTVLNSAHENQVETMDFLTKGIALLVYANPSPSLMTPSGGYTFSWSGLFGGGALGTRIKSFRMEPIASDRVEGEMAFDMKVVSPDVGVFFESVLT